MIAERMQQSSTNAKYYQFYTVATILEHVIDCFHTIVSDETNPYHPPLSWLARKQVKPPKDELFLDLFDECSSPKQELDNSGNDDEPMSSSVRIRLERCTRDLRVDIVSRTKDGCSPLFLACKLGHLNKAKYLLDCCEADIEQKGHFEAFEDHHVHSVSPIWVAAVSGNLEIVRLLIDRGADVNCLSDTGSTPLRSVCFRCKDDDGTHQAHEYDLFDEYSHTSDLYFQIVELLVENGAEVSKPNYNGGTCLINSIHNCRLTKYILDHGGDVNASDRHFKTALHYAIQQGRFEVTKLLLSYGADPMARTNLRDDALQLCCLSGHMEIFNYLIATINYPKERLADAYKLLGSSILEIQYDLSKVRELWHAALQYSRQSLFKSDKSLDSDLEQDVTCDTRRSVAFGDTIEFDDDQELESLLADDFRIQSLVISERILGSDHKETIQRLIYRGTFYINSLRPDRGLDLWIYALKLKVQHESMLHFETTLAAQAITKLFLDLIDQRQRVRFSDVYEVLSILVGNLEECRHRVDRRPTFRLHEEIFDLLLSILVDLLFVLNCATSEPQLKCARRLVRKLIQINPRTTNGSSLLHVCLDPGVLGGRTNRLMRLKNEGVSSILQLIDTLINNGLEVDSINSEGLSALQVLCLANYGASDKKTILKHLVECGAHVDRRASSPEQSEMIRQVLKEAGVDPVEYTTLSCLAARKVAESKIKYDERTLTQELNYSIAMH